MFTIEKEGSDGYVQYHFVVTRGDEVIKFSPEDFTEENAREFVQSGFVRLSNCDGDVFMKYDKNTSMLTISLSRVMVTKVLWK